MTTASEQIQLYLHSGYTIITLFAVDIVYRNRVINTNPYHIIQPGPPENSALRMLADGALEMYLCDCLRPGETREISPATWRNLSLGERESTRINNDPPLTGVFVHLLAELDSHYRLTE